MSKTPHFPPMTTRQPEEGDPLGYADMFVFMTASVGMVLMYQQNGRRDPEKCGMLEDSGIGKAPDDVGQGLYRVRCYDLLDEPSWDNSDWSSWANRRWASVEWRRATPAEAMGVARGEWSAIPDLPRESK